jgi:hypothetical protein
MDPTLIIELVVIIEILYIHTYKHSYHRKTGTTPIEKKRGEEKKKKIFWALMFLYAKNIWAVGLLHRLGKERESTLHF